MRYYLIAGEASGDLHGANLMRGLYAKDPGADIRFWGGGLMDVVYREHQPGSGLVKDYREGAVMGYWEVLMKSRSIFRNLAACKADILAWKPDAVVLIDYPGFNLKIARFAHENGFRVFYYIAPKVWASREGRIKKIKAWVDRLFVVFPFEVAYFTGKGVPCIYKGNPLVDAVDRSSALQEPGEAFLQRHGLPDAPYIALLAGSRQMEIRSMMPVFMAFARQLRAREEYAHWHFVIAAAPGHGAEEYDREGLEGFVHVVSGDTYAVLRHARAAVINSGTASLEAALVGTPQMVCYRVNPLSYQVMRRLIRVPYVSLVNLILGRPAVKEYLQHDFTPEKLLAEAVQLVGDASYRAAMLAEYAQVRALLGGGGASESVAEAMVTYSVS